MLSRKPPEATLAAHNGAWDSRQSLIGLESFGSTAGVIGFGRIGRRVANICNLAFGRRILFASRTARIGQKLGKRVNLDELLDQSDHLSLDVHLSDMTRLMIGGQRFSRMKASSFIMNMANGNI